MGIDYKWRRWELTRPAKMHYCCILYSLKSNIFYIDTVNDIDNGLMMHNRSRIVSTKPHIPWELVWSESFATEKEAREFEYYLKSRSGTEFVYKKLISMVFHNNRNVMES